VRAAREVHGQGGLQLVTAAPEIRGIRKYGIDDQRPIQFVLSDLEANLTVRVDDVVARDFATNAVPLLIDRWLELPYFFRPDTQHEIPVRAANVVRAGKRHANRSRVRSGRGDEVVFETSLTAVIDEVDAVVHVRVPDARVRRYVSSPLPWVVAEEVVAPARQE